MWRRRILAATAVLGVLLAADLSRPPARQWTVAAAVGGIHLYQRTLSRWLSATGVQCRFTPTCSRYAEGVLQKHGGWRGGWLTARRLARCGPWTPMGTNDPIDD